MDDEKEKNSQVLGGRAESQGRVSRGDVMRRLDDVALLEAPWVTASIETRIQSVMSRGRGRTRTGQGNSSTKILPALNGRLAKILAVIADQESSALRTATP